MLLYFPTEEEAITKYLKLIREANKCTKLFYASKALPQPFNTLLNVLSRRKFYKYSDPTVLEVLQTLSSNEKLIGVLTSQWGDYGLPPHRASFMIHAMVVEHYLNGASYPKGGSSEISRTISQTIKENR